ncbi:MAG TPA: Hsp70 family protein, partial [Candidatus Omnitrophota bacterium]|nr:Hsp70 family protein [Candidatus Omnitrophota bacterium]
KEAEKYAEEDKKRKEKVEMINQANTIVYATEKSVKDYGDKVSASEKENIEKEVANLKEAIKTEDADKIKKATESLQKASHKLAEEVYKATTAQQTAGQGPQPGVQETEAGPQPGHRQAGEQKKDADKEDIIDADFKAEDDKK